MFQVHFHHLLIAMGVDKNPMFWLLMIVSLIVKSWRDSSKPSLAEVFIKPFSFFLFFSHLICTHSDVMY